MSAIFINYRRKDSAAYAGRIYDRLSKHFGHKNCFMDIDNIAPGEVFIHVIQEKLSTVQVAVVLIGKQWLNIKNDNGQRRLDNPNDIVRLEIATLLARKIRVIPVLVGGADLPEANQLPESIASLVERNAYEISDVRFNTDVDRLIEALDKIADVKRPLLQTGQNRIIAIIGIMMLVIIMFMINNAMTITQTTHGGDALIHDGTGDINTGDTIIHHYKYDEKK